METETREQLVAAARGAARCCWPTSRSGMCRSPAPPPLPLPMAAFDDGTRVLSLGSVSKSFWGGLRVGWIRAAPPLVQRLAAARALGDMAGPVLDQLVVARCCRNPRRAGPTTLPLGDRSGCPASGAGGAAPAWRPTRPQGGTSLWVKLPGPFATDLALLAPSAGVRIAPGPRFGPDGTMESYLRLPFTTAPERLVAGRARLATIADQAARRPVVVARLAGLIAIPARDVIDLDFDLHLGAGPTDIPPSRGRQWRHPGRTRWPSR